MLLQENWKPPPAAQKATSPSTGAAIGTLLLLRRQLTLRAGCRVLTVDFVRANEHAAILHASADDFALDETRGEIDVCPPWLGAEPGGGQRRGLAAVKLT